MTETVEGGARRGSVDYGLIGEETVEKPRCRKLKSTTGSKTGGGGGTCEPVPSKGVDDTLLCWAANGDRVRVKIMFTLVGGPPPLRTPDGLATFWAYHSQGGCNSNYDRKWDHCPSAAEDLGPRWEYAGRIWAKL